MEFNSTITELKEISNLFLALNKQVFNFNRGIEKQKDLWKDITKKSKEGKFSLVDDDKQTASFKSILSVASQVQNIFRTGSNTVFYNFLQALQVTEQIINLFKSINAVGGVVSLLGKVFGFIFGGPAASAAFASGGFVPGSGSGDTVPARLTPGEFVIRKSRVSELLSRYGQGFLAWLNGGGLTPHTAGSYASGGFVTPVNTKQRVAIDVPDIKIKGSDLYLSWKRQNSTEMKRNR